MHSVSDRFWRKLCQSSAIAAPPAKPIFSTSSAPQLTPTLKKDKPVTLPIQNLPPLAGKKDKRRRRIGKAKKLKPLLKPFNQPKNIPQKCQTPTLVSYQTFPLNLRWMFMRHTLRRRRIWLKTPFDFLLFNVTIIVSSKGGDIIRIDYRNQFSMSYLIRLIYSLHYLVHFNFNL